MSSRSSKWRFKKRADQVLLTGEDSSSSDDTDPAPAPKRTKDSNEDGSARSGDTAGENNEPFQGIPVGERAVSVVEDNAGSDDEQGPVDGAGAFQEPEEDDNHGNDGVAEAHVNVDGNGNDFNINNGSPVAEGIAEDEGLTSESGESSSEEEVSSEEEDEVEVDNEDQNAEDEEPHVGGVAPPHAAANEADHGDEPLYDGAPLTLGQSLIAIMTFVLTHALTGNGLADLLKLIAIHCPPNNRCVKSLFTFHKHFKGVGRAILKFHYYCCGCYELLESKNSVCTKCDENHGVSFFIEVPLARQLQIMFKRPGFLNDLQFRFNRVKTSQNNVEDIYDSDIYMEQFQNDGFLGNPYHMSFMWYSDGVSLFNSKNFSIWPIYLVINELGYKKRVKKENIILAGIWFGKKKPKVNSFLSPIHSELQKFSTAGYVLDVPNGPPIRVKGILLCGTCDMPAKSTFLRFTQFNGNFGCPRCMQRGQSYNDNPLIRVYPFEPNVEPRSNAEVEHFARVAVATGHPCYGVKGLSPLYRMVPDMVRSTGIDVMHGTFSGVGKSLIELWFEKIHEGKDYSLRHLIENVNERLKLIKVPTFLNKFPQSIDNISTWKSLDFKVWLMYYSVPVLLGLMPDDYMEHHMLLVSGIYLLSQRSVSPNQIDRASALLEQYVVEFQTLYDVRYMGINVHQLLHMGNVVRHLGPTWVYACYFLEDLNGIICRFIHGTSHVGKQVASTTTILQQLSSLINELPAESPVRMFCDKLNKVGRKYKISEHIADGIFVVGKFVPLPNPPQALLHEHMNIVGGHCQLFSRLWLKGVLYLSESYTRAAKRKASYVMFKTDEGEICMGSIRYFIRWSDCDCVVSCLCQPCEYICFIHVYEAVAWKVHEHPNNVSLAYMNAVQPSEYNVCIPVSNLICLCFHLVMPGNHQYIVQRVNELEAE